MTVSSPTSTPETAVPGAETAKTSPRDRFLTRLRLRAGNALLAMVALGAMIGIVEAFSRTVVPIPNPGLLYVIAVCLVSLSGGRMAGLAASLILVAFYALVPGRTGGTPSTGASDALVRVLVMAVAAPSAALLCGGLKQRGDRLLSENIRADAARSAAEMQARALRDRERVYTTLAENSPDMIARIDRDLRFTFINERGAALRGRTPSEFIGKTARDLGLPGNGTEDDFARAAAWETAIRTVLQTGVAQTLSFAARDATGEPRLYETRLVPETGDNGGTETVLSLMRDVTEREKVTEALRRSEAELSIAVAKQKRIAGTLQRSLLSPSLPQILDGDEMETAPGAVTTANVLSAGRVPFASEATGHAASDARIEVATVYESAWDEALIGGDFYDVIWLSPTRVALVVGDATGKGLAAAAYTAEVKFALRAFLRDDQAENPDRLDAAPALARLNRFLFGAQNFGGRATSALICLALAIVELETGIASIIGAGMEPPLLVRHGAKTAEAVTNYDGAVLGGDETFAFHAVTLCLAPGDLLLMATDGITEARQRSKDREFFGYEGFAETARCATAEALNAQANAVPQDAALVDAVSTRIVSDARRWAGGAFQDDVCLLVARLPEKPSF